MRWNVPETRAGWLMGKIRALIIYLKGGLYIYFYIYTHAYVYDFTYLAKIT